MSFILAGSVYVEGHIFGELKENGFNETINYYEKKNHNFTAIWLIPFYYWTNTSYENRKYNTHDAGLLPESGI